jgi:hypothetical protein
MMLRDEIADIILDREDANGELTESLDESIDKILSLPSDFEGMTIGDVLEQFGKMLDTLRDMSNLPDSYPIMAVCSRAEYAITHNGQPIRRQHDL